MTKPLVLALLPGLEGLLAAYELVYPPTDETRAAFLRDTAHRIEAAVGIGSNPMPDDLLAALTGLKLIAVFGAGYDGYDPAALKARGVALTNCPNINNEDVADVAMGLLISVARDIAKGDALVRAGDWRKGLVWPRSLKGRKLGIVGMGAIGAAIAARAAPFGLDIRWFGPRAKGDVPYPYEPDLAALAAWADILAVACRADASTEKLIDARIIDALGPEGILVNVSRGSVVDEDALIAALKARTLYGAGLDVFAEEPTPAARWAGVPNVTLTPHLAGGTRDSIIASGRLVAENLRRHFAGEPLATPVAA
ncbi:MAG: 2-hydroxyacid dehydrogenase [Hydrogenophilaceae bacterium]|jgi:lactate dehydrogenase-like 2-hydroxyacid dehydrogenase|nr:2-hydroxyacid dehydrogenase [Hydrogenophilaceae bacterium]